MQIAFIKIIRKINYLVPMIFLIKVYQKNLSIIKIKKILKI